MSKAIQQQERKSANRKRISLLDTQIDCLTMQQAVDLAMLSAQSKQPLHIVGVNADKINQMRRDERLREIVNGCGMIHADGASVVMASRLLGDPLPERIAGIDFMERLVDMAEQKQYRVFLLGATQDVVEKTARAMQSRHPGLALAGLHNGYFGEADWPRISQLLAEADPDFVFVGISSPMKELLIEKLQSEGHRCVFMGVGGSFDVLSGELHRAPMWVQKANMEWFFRMLQEPQRLMKRYLV